MNALLHIQHTSIWAYTHTKHTWTDMRIYTHAQAHSSCKFSIYVWYVSDTVVEKLMVVWQTKSPESLGGREGGKWLCRINLCRPSSKIKHRQPLHLTSQIWKYSLRVRAKTQLWKYSLRVRAQQQRNYERFTSAFHINLWYCDVYFSKIYSTIWDGISNTDTYYNAL